MKDFTRALGGIVRKLQQASREFQRELNMYIHESDEKKSGKDDLSG